MQIVLDARLLRSTTGGIGRYSQALISHLAQLESPHHFSVVMTEADRADWQLLVADHPQLKNWTIRFDGPAHYSLAEQIRLPAILAELQPNLVHFLNVNHSVRYQAPFVVTVHDLTIQKYPVGPHQRSPLMQAAYRLVLGHAARASRAIVAVSHHTKQDILTNFQVPNEKIIVIYEGVDDRYQPVSLPQRGRAQRQMQEVLGIHAPYLLFVSQWRPHKGILLLIDAYERLCDKLREKNRRALLPQLVVAGKPHPAYPEILARIEGSRYRNHIITPGFVDEALLPALYQGADAFVFPSEYEGFGLTPLEAMASGTPVLAANTSSLPEVVGDAGLLLPAHDPVAWADALQKIVDDRTLWRTLRAAGMKQARHFSWEKMTAETLAVYDSIL